MNNDKYTWHLVESAGLSRDHEVRIGELQAQERFFPAELTCSSFTFADISKILCQESLCLFLTVIRRNQGMLRRETSQIKRSYPVCLDAGYFWVPNANLYLGVLQNNKKKRRFLLTEFTASYTFGVQITRK